MTYSSDLLRRYETLLEVGEVIHAFRDIDELFHNLAELLRRVIQCDGIAVGLLDESKQAISLRLAENWGAFPPEIGRSVPLSAIPGSVVIAEQRAIRFSTPEHAPRYPVYAEVMKRAEWKTSYGLPLTTALTKLGAIGFNFKDDVHLSEQELTFMQQVVDQVAIAIENAQNFHQAQTSRTELERRNAQQELLLKLTNHLVSNLELKELLQAVAAGVRRAVPCAGGAVMLPNKEGTLLRVEALDFPDSRGHFTQHFTIPMQGSMTGRAFAAGEPLVINNFQKQSYLPAVGAMIEAEGFKSHCFMPFSSGGKSLGVLTLASREENAFTPGDVEFLRHVAVQVTLAFENSLNFERIRTAERERQRERDRLQLLMNMTNQFVSNVELTRLLQEVTTSVRRIVPCACLLVMLPDSDASRLVLRAIDFPDRRGFLRDDLVVPIGGSMAGKAFRTGSTIVKNDTDPANYDPEIYRVVVGEGFKAQCFIPLISHGRTLGVLTSARREESAFPPEDVNFLNHIAGQVALAVENSMSFEAVRAAEQQEKRERDRLELLMHFNNRLASNLELADLLQATAASVRKLMQCDIVTFHLPNAQGTALETSAMDFPDGRWVFEDQPTPLQGTLHGEVFRTARPMAMARLDTDRFPIEAAFLGNLGILGGCIVPMIHGGRVLGNLGLGRCEEKAFTEEEIIFLSQLGTQVAIAIENALAYREIGELKEKLSHEKLYLEDEIRSEINFKEIVGESTSLKVALEKVATVAPSDATVLILGETGTGKELIARAIHDASRRKGRTFVKLNCAAIPTGLLESELFGHEKGAFTGAIAQKIGRMELANGGTLFLDEVGDIPLELQPKLLRALQEREFERLGSVRTQKADVRILAATNRDLQEMVAEKEFRSDLYYRLNVFPISIPALRERHGDIPRLIRYFVSKYAKKMDKRIESIPSAAMQKLQAWHWPGNVRELENFIERSVILTQGEALHVPLAELESEASEQTPVPTLRETERDHIIKILKETRGTLAGPNGAAARLGVKRTTLQYKMKKLGITRDSY